MLLEMSLILMYGTGKPIIQIGRMVGQFAKPRSYEFEHKDNKILPVYRGDIINNFKFTFEDRIYNPENMIQAYYQSTQTLNLLRAFNQGGYSNIYNLNLWSKNSKFGLGSDPKGSKEFIKKVEDALRFLRATEISENHPSLQLKKFYTGHECLLLDYEECLTRKDSISNNYYACSAHFLWIGERTCYLNSSHVEFLRGVNNPIGIKLSSKTNIQELIQIIKVLNPTNVHGKIILTIRMGSKLINNYFEQIIKEIKNAKLNVGWMIDPMHRQTFELNGFKTRYINDIKEELDYFFDICHKNYIIPAGIHLEMTQKM